MDHTRFDTRSFDALCPLKDVWALRDSVANAKTRFDVEPVDFDSTLGQRPGPCAPPSYDIV